MVILVPFITTNNRVAIPPVIKLDSCRFENWGLVNFITSKTQGSLISRFFDRNAFQTFLLFLINENAVIKLQCCWFCPLFEWPHYFWSISLTIYLGPGGNLCSCNFIHYTMLKFTIWLAILDAIELRSEQKKKKKTKRRLGLTSSLDSLIPGRFWASKFQNVWSKIQNFN